MTPTRIALLVAATAALAAGEEWSKSFPVPVQPELRAATNDASVQVRVGAASRIDVRVIATGWKLGGTDGVRITDRQAGGLVELDVRLPDGQWNLGTRSVRVEITAPARTSAEIRSGNGNVAIDGLQGILRLRTGDGNIDVQRADGSLDATTGDGNIVARGRFDALKVRTGDGNVDVEAHAGSKLASPWRIETGDGGVQLRLPADLAADLDVHTGDGHISSELNVAVAGPASGSTLRGRMNGGGLPLTVRTGDGSIRLTRL